MQRANIQKKRPCKWGFTAIVLFGLLILLTSCSARDSGEAAGDANSNTGGNTNSADNVQTIQEGENLVIPIGEISSTAKFYPVNVDGTNMEVLAVQTADGEMRTAFNTCEVCNGSPDAYFIQSGDVLVCQNCGSQFPMSQVEVDAGGCNPWPIFIRDKTVTDESITISYDVLKASQDIFANWKKNT